MPTAADKPQGCTNFKLRQLTRLVSQHYDAEMSRIGLKTTQYSLLAHVARLGPIRPGDLARVMALDASTLTRNLKPLVDAGWVALSAGTDARSRSITITAAGLEKREQARRHWQAAQDGLNKMLGIERVKALHALIDGSLELLSGIDAGSSDE